MPKGVIRWVTPFCAIGATGARAVAATAVAAGRSPLQRDRSLVVSCLRAEPTSGRVWFSQLMLIRRFPFRWLFGLFAATTTLTVGNVEARPLPAWVTAKPSPETQTQTPAAERGINPCMTPDPGFGIYGGWHREVRFGQYLRPEVGGLRRDGSFDVMFHFHGHEAIRKEWVKSMRGAVLASVDLGVGSGAYESAFQDPTAFKEYLASVETAMAKATGRPQAHARHIGLSAWSAGYGAILKILEQPLGRRVDTLILLDGLHSGYVDGHVDGRPIQSVIDFAKAAAIGKNKLFFLSHSSIMPPGYASTSETAQWLAWSVGGRPRTDRSTRRGTHGLDLLRSYDRGNFHVRGYGGNDKMDHCAHIGLYKDVLDRYVLPRWKSPLGHEESGSQPPRHPVALRRTQS